MGFGRVQDHVKGWGTGSYLKRDGWWAQLVLDEFAFLGDLGFSLSGDEYVGIHFHFRGNYVWFAGPHRDVAIEYDSDDPARMWIAADVIEHDPPLFVPLDAYILKYLPEAVPPSRQPLDRAAVETNVRWWASCLRRIASEVL